MEESVFFWFLDNFKTFFTQWRKKFIHLPFYTLEAANSKNVEYLSEFSIWHFKKLLNFPHENLVKILGGHRTWINIHGFQPNLKIHVLHKISFLPTNTYCSIGCKTAKWMRDGCIFSSIKPKHDKQQRICRHAFGLIEEHMELYLVQDSFRRFFSSFYFAIMTYNDLC